MPGADEFLKELADLTAKHGLVIGGCGCCGSPFLERTDDDSTDRPTRFNLTYSAVAQRYTVDPE